MTDIAKNLADILQRIRASEIEFGMRPGQVQLLAASKGQKAEKIVAAINAGQLIFGENYLQEALLKMQTIAELRPAAAVEWHFIGPIQSNKTRKIAENFSWVQGVASNKIADRLNEQRPAHLPPLNICIEINADAEPTKSGVSFAEAPDLIRYCAILPRLRVRGIMAIPQEQTDFAAQRKEFHKLYLLWKELALKGFELDTLSMGMTADYLAAIAEGSTMVRIGTGIFGQRKD